MAGVEGRCAAHVEPFLRRSSSVVPSGSARAAGQILVLAAEREHLVLNVLKAKGVFVVLVENLRSGRACRWTRSGIRKRVQFQTCRGPLDKTRIRPLRQSSN